MNQVNSHPSSSTGQEWNAGLYDNRYAYVWNYGAGLIENLSPREGERILDLGCGTGHLTAKIGEKGAAVVGIDSSPGMIEQAQSNYPELPFEVADARNFHFPEPFDAVFSNATLHWIREPDPVIQRIYDSLKPGGRFVAEFGGRGNIRAILKGLTQAVEDLGLSTGEDPNPWYFPDIPEYGALLEGAGFELINAVLFDRPTVLEGGESGLRSWMEMFGSLILSRVPQETRSSILHHIENTLRPTLFHDGNWHADYRRLRIVAIRKDH